MRKSRPLQWIEDAEARQILTIARSETNPKPPRARAVQHLREWLRHFCPLLFPRSPLLRAQPIRIDARIRRGCEGDKDRDGVC